MISPSGKKVSTINRKHLPLPNVLNVYYGEKDIANMWGDHYETLLTCAKSDECKEKMIDFLSSDSNITNVFIQPCHVKEALKSAKLGQACLSSLKSTCARVTINLDLRARILLTYVYTH